MKRILYVLSIALFVSCGNTNSQVIKDVNAEKFHQLIEKGDGIIIDVRTTQEFSSGHIIDATNIDYYSKDFYTDNSKDPVNATATSDNKRVRRGGSWNYHSATLLTYSRAADFENRGNNHFGFRIVKSN